MIDKKTANGMTWARRPSDASASSAPRPPSTSAIPTTPDTASVSSAQATNAVPANHAVIRRRVSRQPMATNSAPFTPCKSRLNQCCGQEVRMRAERSNGCLPSSNRSDIHCFCESLAWASMMRWPRSPTSTRPRHM
jgi:hypothetical protein